MDQLREWRKAKGFSTQEAGALVGVSGVQWSRYETGTRQISADKLSAVATETGISARDLRPDLAEAFDAQPDRAAREGAAA